jgi:hypothetical protein
LRVLVAVAGAFGSGVFVGFGELPPLLPQAVSTRHVITSKPLSPRMHTSDIVRRYPRRTEFANANVARRGVSR